MTGILTSTGLILADADDDILGLLGSTSEVVLQDLLGAVGISGLGIQSRSRVMGNHAVSTTEGVLHRAPWVVLGSGLHIPHITSVAAELSAGKGSSNSVLVADGTTSGVDEPCTLLEVLEQLGVDQSTGTLVKRAVDSDNIALRDELLEVLDAARLHSLGSGSGERSVVVVEELLGVEGLQTLENAVADATSTDGPNDLALHIKGVAGNVRDLPVTALDHLVGGDKVADEEEDAHDDVLCDRGDVRAGHLEDLDPAVDGSVEIDVVRADTCSDADLEVLGLVDELLGKVARVEGGGDEDLSIDDVLLEVAVWAFLAARHWWIVRNGSSERSKHNIPTSSWP